MPPVKIKKRANFLAPKFGRGIKIRTRTRGFGDRHATIDTIPLSDLIIITQKKTMCKRKMKKT